MNDFDEDTWNDAPPPPPRGMPETESSCPSCPTDAGGSAHGQRVGGNRDDDDDDDLLGEDTLAALGNAELALAGPSPEKGREQCSEDGGEDEDAATDGDDLEKREKLEEALFGEDTILAMGDAEAALALSVARQHSPLPRMPGLAKKATAASAVHSGARVNRHYAVGADNTVEAAGVVVDSKSQVLNSLTGRKLDESTFASVDGSPLMEQSLRCALDETQESCEVSVGVSQRLEAVQQVASMSDIGGRKSNEKWDNNMTKFDISSFQEGRDDAEEIKLQPEMMWIKSMGEYHQTHQDHNDSVIGRKEEERWRNYRHLETKGVDHNEVDGWTEARTVLVEQQLNSYAGDGQHGVTSYRFRCEGDDSEEHVAAETKSPYSEFDSHGLYLEMKDKRTSPGVRLSDAIPENDTAIPSIGPVRSEQISLDELLELGEQQMRAQHDPLLKGQVSSQQSTDIDDGSVLNRRRSEMQALLETSDHMVKPNECGEGNAEVPNAQRMKKKPFLRKGTRKEPSAIHRMNGRDHAHADDDDVAAKKKKIEELEKMQRDQMEQLEHRRKRRETARQDQRKMKQNGLTPKRMSEHEQFGKKPEEKAASHHSELDDKNTTEGTHLSDQFQESNFNPDKENDSAVLSPNVRGQSGSKRLNVKGKALRSSDDRRTRALSTREQSSMIGKDATRDGAVESRTADEESDKLQREDDQWQMLKSMRRRQEAALKEAEKERETAKAWAAAERESVRKWADEQRALVKKDRHRAANAAMATQRQTQEDLRKRAAAAAEYTVKRDRAEIDALRATIQKLKVDLDWGKSRHQAREKMMKDKIRKQNETIKQLQDQISTLDEEKRERSTSWSRGSKAAGVRHTKAKVGGKGRSPTKTPSDLTKKKSQRPRSSRVETESGQKGIAGNDQKERQTTETPHIGQSKADRESRTDKRSESDDRVQALTNSSNECVEETKNADSIGTASDNNISTFYCDDPMEEPTERWLRRNLAKLHNSAAAGLKAGSAGQSLTTQAGDFDVGIAQRCLASAAAHGHDSKPTVGEGNNTPQLGSPLNVLQTPFHKKRYNPLDYSQNSCASEKTSVQTKLPSSRPGSTNAEGGMSTGKGRTEEVCSDGSRFVSYRNGTKKEVQSDGTSIVRFTNGDIKTNYSNGVVEYYYASSKTTHTTHADGLETYVFPNEQVENHYPDGKKEIMFPDGTKKVVFSNGANETVFADGVRVLEFPDGTKQITRY